MRHATHILLALALSGCWDNQDGPFGTMQVEYESKPDADTGKADSQAVSAIIDKDKDKVEAGKDCDDDDPKVGAASLWFYDSDLDGSASDKSLVSCKQPAGYIADTVGMLLDCNDGNVKVFPGAPELCDNIDNDCNGKADEAELTEWFIDADGDGRGDPGGKVKAGCKAPTKKLVANSLDCDDLNDTVYDGAAEKCDLIDNDCDGQIDEGVKIPVFVDDDKDGHGDKNKKSSACKAEGSFVLTSDDCDDTSDKVKPGAVEICNEVDDNCNGLTDEDVKKSWRKDVDGDGYGDKKAVTAVLACTKPADHADNSLDCNDAVASINPAQLESCNGIDDNCDGQTDPIDSEGVKTFYLDSDGDGQGVDSPTTIWTDCQKPSNYATVAGDCDNTKKTVFKGAPEFCDGLDNDCDGVIDEGASGACDDNDPWTIDTCVPAPGGCTHTTLEVVLTCTLPSSPTSVEGDVCSVGLFFSKGEDFGPLSVKKDKVVIKGSELCPKLKAGQMLRVTSLAEYAEGESKWVGGEHVQVKEGPDSKLVKGTPGDISKLNIGLEFNYVLSDFKICQ